MVWGGGGGKRYAKNVCMYASLFRLSSVTQTARRRRRRESVPTKKMRALLENGVVHCDTVRCKGKQLGYTGIQGNKIWDTQDTQNKKVLGSTPKPAWRCYCADFYR